MLLSRRDLLVGAAATLLPLPAKATQTAPAWVPAGSPPFFSDSFGLIVQADMDGGDTTQREGFVRFGLHLLEKAGITINLAAPSPWPNVLAHLEVGKSGEFRRHPNKDQWWSDPQKFSRDQQTPLVAALGALGPREVLDRLWNAFVARGRKCQNGDAGGPDHQNLFRRATGYEKVEAIGEGLLAAMPAVLVLRGQKSKDDVGDDLNFIVSLAASKLWRPTKTSRQTIIEYRDTRPVNYGCYLERYRKEYPGLSGQALMKKRIDAWIAKKASTDCHPAVGALRWYFRPETGAGWGPAAIYERVLLDYLFVS